MKKYFILAAAAALVLGACSKNEVKLGENGTPVTFSTYLTKVKAGQTGPMTNDLLASQGFGVFAYYTDDASYSASATPNFMYNEQVTKPSSDWVYSPVKYWPNEYGATADSGTYLDKVSFFAYAPFVNHTASLGSTGITSLTANDVAGDPKVTYVVGATTDEVVDLLWGVVTTAAATTDNEVEDNASLTAGLPYLNMTKQTNAGKVDLLFKHATSRINVNVEADFDVASGTVGTADGELDAASKITIQSITVKGGFANGGVLNLNNTTENVAKWESLTYEDGTNKVSTLTIDKDHSLHANLQYTTGKKASELPAGVTEAQVNVLTGAAPAAADPYFTVVPGEAGKAYEIEIVYYVTTDDTNLNGGKLEVKNDIKKTTESITIASGKVYNFNLVLGMTTVKLQATVEDWDATVVDTEVDLPVNA